MRCIRGFAESESGATSIEYALIAAFIGIVIVSAVTATGDAVSNTFNNVSSAF
jgi:pilus assembly protein Flp/PilA